MGNHFSSSKSIPEHEIKYLNKGMTEGLNNGRLDLWYSEINDSIMPKLCEWIIKLDNKVQVLDLRGNRFTSVGASMLFDTLKANNSFIHTILLFQNIQIDDKCMKSLGEYIKSNKYIEKVLLGDNSISDVGIKILTPYLEGNTTFKSLRLSNNKGITDKSKPLLMKMIESSCIEHIDIDNTLITQMNTLYTLSACNAIKNGSTSLDLYENDLNDGDLIKICDTMKKYGIDKLNDINLVNTKITSKGASTLFDTLKECNSVVSNLYLSKNQLDDECMKQLGEYLQDNERVKELMLESNKITDKGVEILSEYLIGNTTSDGLYLGGNTGITDASVPHLIELAKKSCITRLDIRDTSISKEKQQEIMKACSIPIEQREIPIKSNTKSAAKISAST